VLELLDDVCELLLDWSCAVMLLCGGSEPFGGGVEEEGVLVEGVDVELPAFPEMLPALLSLLDGVADEELLATVSSLSSTFFTPETDLASFFASFLSSLLATVPLSLALPFSTLTCTPWRAGFPANCW